MLVHHNLSLLFFSGNSNRIFHQTVDSKGLITADRQGLQEHKKCLTSLFPCSHRLIFSCPDFARTDYEGPTLTKLIDIIEHVKPTALLGLSTIPVGHMFMPFLSTY